MKTEQEENAPFRRHLVNELQRRGVISSPSVAHAFLKTPREVFVPQYYRDAGRAGWTLCPGDVATLYQDQALVTRIDAQQMPISSSSQPSVMACMLETLDIQPGMRVLEIGTGTGYNASLLANLAGDPAKITSVELDPELAVLARERIERVVGPGMALITGDGCQGVPEHSPYDRIIATASAFPVPPAWIEQLAPSGRLLLDLRGEMGGGLMEINKQGDGNAFGHFLAGNEAISFMGLRPSARSEASAMIFEMPPQDEQQWYAPGTVEHACASHFASYERFRSEDSSFNIWVQCLFPTLSIRWFSREQRTFARLRENTSQTVLTVEQRVDQHVGVTGKGPSPLWQQLLQAHAMWCSFGKPERTAMTLTITPTGQIMQIEQQEQYITLPIC